jgi:hypothetical protein
LPGESGRARQEPAAGRAPICAPSVCMARLRCHHPSPPLTRVNSDPTHVGGTFRRGYGTLRTGLAVVHCECNVGLLVYSHVTDREAWALLHDESEWSDDIESVELLDTRLCLHCRGRFDLPQQRFCDVVCEAAFSAAACS